LIVGQAGGKRVAVLSGRVHLYEGWTPQQVVFGVRVMGLLGVKVLILTNAAGGIRETYRPGMQVFLTDHINLQGMNPLTGPNDDSLGPRFPDMSEAYDRELLALARQTARELGMETGEGVYAAMLGPSFETPAEIRYLRTIGADLAGMSTVAEVIAARHMGMRVLAISTVTNMAAGMQARLSHEEVLETGKASAAELKRFLEAYLAKLEV
jgi:purine-nucleoside phosphorylase